MKKFFLILLVLVGLMFRVTAADRSYKRVLVFPHAEHVRIRLPLTDVTGKVRVKQWTSGGYGQPVAPTRTRLGRGCYLEWQIGYDLPTTNSPSIVPQIHFRRDGEIKYGHELTKILLEAVQLGLLSTNDLLHQVNTLKEISPTEFEENQSVRVAPDTNAAPDGFQRSVRRVPQFSKRTPYGRVLVRLRQKQHAVGFQAMVYVCLPLKQVLTLQGKPRPSGRAHTKETVYYDFTQSNAGLLLDIVQAFGIASQRHNEDMQRILEKIIAVTR